MTDQASSVSVSPAKASIKHRAAGGGIVVTKPMSKPPTDPRAGRNASSRLDQGFGPAPGRFEDFYLVHRDTVGRALSLTRGDESLGFEAADEAMTRAYERWSDVASYENPEGWVYRTGLNWARSWLRRRKRGAAKDRLTARPSQSHDVPFDADLAVALQLLPEDQRAVVVLRYYRDWDVAQTAAALAIAPGTVKSRLSRATDRLQQLLSATDPNTNPKDRNDRSGRKED